MGFIPALPDMFPALSSEIEELRALGLDDDEIVEGIAQIGGREAGAFNLPAPPRPGFFERAGQAAKESVSFELLQRPEDFPQAESPGGFFGAEPLAEITGELAGFLPLLLAAEFTAPALVGKVAGKGFSRAAGKKVLAGLSPFGAGVARGAGVAGALKVPQVGAATVRAARGEGDVSDIVSTLLDPRDLLIFAGLGGLTKLGRAPILGDPKFRRFIREARVLEGVDEAALTREAIPQMFRRPGEMQFTHPDVQALARRIFEGKEVPRPVKPGAEVPSREGFLLGEERFPSDLDRITTMLGPERFESPLEPGQAPPLGFQAPLPPPIPPITEVFAKPPPGTQLTKLAREGPSPPPRTASLRNPPPTAGQLTLPFPPGAVRVYRGQGEPVGEGGAFFTSDPQRAASFGPNVSFVDISAEAAADAQAAARRAGSGTPTDYVLPSKLVNLARPVPGGVRPRVFELENVVEETAARQLGLPGIPEGGFRGIRAGTEIAGGIDLKEITPQTVAGLGSLGAAWFARLGKDAGGKVWNRIKQTVKDPAKIAPHQKEIMGRARSIGARIEQAEIARLPQLHELMQTAKRGDFAIEWYDPTTLRQEFGPNADLMADFLAATSPMTAVEGNLTLALRAFRQWQDGLAFDGFSAQVQANLMRAARGEPLSGQKINNFAQALKGDQNSVVVDRWMMRVFNQPGIDPTAKQYALAESLIRDLAREMGVTPAQAQAALWGGAKAQAQGAAGVAGAQPIGALLARRLKQIDLFAKGRAAAPEITAVTPKELDYVGFISAEKADLAPEQARNLMEALRRDLHDAGLTPKEAAGRFEGLDESSFMVPLQTSAQEILLRELGDKYGQRAIIVGRGAKAELRSLSAAGVDAGQSVRAETVTKLGLDAVDNFSEISTDKGPFKFSYNFNFDKKTPFKEMARLEHYSPKAQDVIAPVRAGTGPFKGAEQRRAGLPKSFWYVEGTPVEPRFQGMVRHYAEVPLALYDVKRDPLGFAKGGQTALQFEQRIQAAGYDGFTDGNIVASFKPIRPWASGFHPDSFLSPVEQEAFATSVKREVDKRIRILMDEGIFPGRPQQLELPLRAQMLGDSGAGRRMVSDLGGEYGLNGEPVSEVALRLAREIRKGGGKIEIGGVTAWLRDDVMVLQPTGRSLEVVADPMSLPMLPDLQVAAEKAGLQAQIIMRGDEFGGVRLTGQIEGKLINAEFRGPADALQFLGEHKPFDPVPETLKFSPDEMARQTIRQRMAEKTETPTRPGFKGRYCLSPCVNVTLTTDAKRAQILEALKETPAEGEAARLVTGKLPFLKSIASQFKNVPTFGKLLSPSFYLEKFPGGLDMIRGIDEGYRKMYQWIRKHNEDLAKTPFGKIREGTPEALAVGLILDKPEFRSKFTSEIRSAADPLKAKLEEHFREIGELLPGEKVKRVKDYFTRIFDREELELGLKQDIETLQKSDSPTAAGRLAQMRETLRKVQAGEQIIYEALPESLRMRFFESRRGREGYSFDAVKAYRTYQGALGRKLILGPISEALVPKISDLPLAYRSLAKAYLRDAFGFAEQLMDPADRVSRIVKEVQFIRTIGFNPTTAVKNLFQQLVTGAEIGFKHVGRGWQSYLTEAGRRVFDDSGHALDVPQMFLHERSTFTPMWQQAVHYAGWMFNKVETTNRAVSYLGALSRWFERNGAKAGLTFEEALERRAIPRDAKVFADDIVRKTQFRYGKVDLSLALREPVLGALFQFASFPIKIGELIWKWAAREGAAGRMKLMAFVAASSGVAALGDLMDTPTLADDTGAPMDLTEMVRVMGAMTEGDWAKARSALGRGVKPPFLGLRFGPSGSLITDLSEVGRRFIEGEKTSKLIQTFGKRNLSAVPINRLIQAVEQFEAGGSPRDFIQAVAGFPTGDGIVRRQYLRLVEQGKMEVARELLAEYRKTRGGNLPLNYAKVREIRREHEKERKQAKREIKGETRSQRITRRFRGDVERVIL